MAFVTMAADRPMIDTDAVGRGWVMSATMVPTKMASMCMPSASTSGVPSSASVPGTGRNQMIAATTSGRPTRNAVQARPGRGLIGHGLLLVARR